MRMLLRLKKRFICKQVLIQCRHMSMQTANGDTNGNARFVWMRFVDTYLALHGIKVGPRGREAKMIPLKAYLGVGRFEHKGRDIIGKDKIGRASCRERV